MVVVVTAALPYLMACGAEDGASTSSTGASSAGSGAEVLVELATSGGEDGRGMGDLAVSADGEVQRRDPHGGIETTTMSADELGVLVAALDDADFAGAPAEPDIDDVCPDALVYKVVYQEWQVTADGCTVPEQVAPVVEQLQALLGRFG